MFSGLMSRWMTPLSWALASEPLGEDGIAPSRRGQDFQGHDAVERLLPRPIDRAHAATAQKFQDVELREVFR